MVNSYSADDEVEYSDASQRWIVRLRIELRPIQNFQLRPFKNFRHQLRIGLLITTLMKFTCKLFC